VSVTTERLIEDTVTRALACYETGVLPDALDELAIRADLAGAGPLLDEWARKRVKRQRFRRRWLARRGRR
jgi:hypothetical protein